MDGVQKIAVAAGFTMVAWLVQDFSERHLNELQVRIDALALRRSAAS